MAQTKPFKPRWCRAINSISMGVTILRFGWTGWSDSTTHIGWKRTFRYCGPVTKIWRQQRASRQGESGEGSEPFCGPLSRRTNTHRFVQEGDTALLHAADGGHLDTVKLLLQSGANKDRQNKVWRYVCFMAIVHVGVRIQLGVVHRYF